MLIHPSINTSLGFSRPLRSEYFFFEKKKQKTLAINLVPPGKQPLAGEIQPPLDLAEFRKVSYWIQKRRHFHFVKSAILHLIRRLQPPHRLHFLAPLRVNLGVLIRRAIAKSVLELGQFRLGLRLLPQRVIRDGQAFIVAPGVAARANVYRRGSIALRQQRERGP